MALFFAVADWIIFAVTACILLYLYASRHRNYWKNQNVVHEKFSLLLGFAKMLLTKPRCLADQDRYQKMGRLFGIYELGQPNLVVGEPELVKQVLLKDFSSLPNRRLPAFADPMVSNMMVLAPVERWRRIRPTASPAFSTAKLRKMYYLVQDCARVTCEHLKEAGKKNAEIDMKQFFGHYALDVIARCAFGTQLDSHTDATNQFVTKARVAISPKMTWKLAIGLLFPALGKHLNVNPASIEVLHYFKKLCQRIINDRRKDETRKEDFLQLMMDAQDGKLSGGTDILADQEGRLFDIGSETKPEATPSVKRLTEDEAMAQCILFFLAGLDTTSTTLTFATYLLAVHPDAQERLRREVDDCIATHGPEPNLDVISKLKYLHCVVSETLRLYPPATRIERVANKDYVIGDTSVKLPKGCVVIVPVYSMHRDPEFFPDPDSFNPDRFSDENMESIKPYSYLPFGAGPRNCIGMRLAIQTVKLCLLHCIHNVQFVRTENTQVPLRLKRGVGILSAEDVILGVRQRPDHLP
ncbi:cytochrome P450 3A24-like [Haemaphysalis longicornis]